MRVWIRCLVVCATVTAVGFTPLVAAACALFCGPAMVHAAASDVAAAPVVDEHAGHHASHAGSTTPAHESARPVHQPREATGLTVFASHTVLSAGDCCPALTAVPAEPARVDRHGVSAAGTAVAVRPDAVPARPASSPAGLSLRPPRDSRVPTPSPLPLRI